jgi:hypothetical protein
MKPSRQRNEEQRKRIVLGAAISGAMCCWSGLVAIYLEMSRAQTDPTRFPPASHTGGIGDFIGGSGIAAFVIFALGCGLLIAALCFRPGPRTSKRVFFVHRKIAPAGRGANRNAGLTHR